jgi:hypothetical protein
VVLRALWRTHFACRVDTHVDTSHPFTTDPQASDVCDHHHKHMKLVLAILLAAGVIAAQTSAPPAGTLGKSDWAGVKRLAAGQEIRVSLSDGKSFRGQLQSATDESLIMVAASSQQTLARLQISKVATKGDSHRARNALIGLGIGAGGGLAIGAAGDSTCHSDCFVGNNIGKEVLTPVGAIVGTIVGVAWPTGGWHEVYRSK